VLVIPPDPQLLYDQGSHWRRAPAPRGDEAREDVSQSQQILRQVRAELEELLKSSGAKRADLELVLPPVGRSAAW